MICFGSILYCEEVSRNVAFELIVIASIAGIEIDDYCQTLKVEVHLLVGDHQPLWHLNHFLSDHSS